MNLLATGDSKQRAYLVVNHKASPVRGPAHNVILIVVFQFTQHVVQFDRKISIRGLRPLAFRRQLEKARVVHLLRGVVNVIVHHTAARLVVGSNSSSCFGLIFIGHNEIARCG